MSTSSCSGSAQSQGVTQITQQIANSRASQKPQASAATSPTEELNEQPAERAAEAKASGGLDVSA